MKLSIKEKSKKDIFISLFQLLKNCSTIINIQFDEKKLYIQGMDKSHICLFDITIFAEWFETYEKHENDTNNICLNTIFFHNIISMTQEKHVINIHYEGNPDSMNVDLTIEENNGNAKGEYNKYFKLPLAELEIEQLNIPTIEYDAEFMMNAKKINEITSQLMIFGDIMNIKCTEEKIDLISKGISGEMMVNIPIDDLCEYSISEDEVIDLSYSLNYIHKMCLTTKLSNEIEFCIHKEYPMKIKYDLGQNSSVFFFIAPKIVEE